MFWSAVRSLYSSANLAVDLGFNSSLQSASISAVCFVDLSSLYQNARKGLQPVGYRTVLNENCLSIPSKEVEIGILELSDDDNSSPRQALEALLLAVPSLKGKISEYMIWRSHSVYEFTLGRDGLILDKAVCVGAARVMEQAIKEPVLLP